MRDVIDLIIAAFVAFLPLFFLLLRRRRNSAKERIPSPTEDSSGAGVDDGPDVVTAMHVDSTARKEAAGRPSASSNQMHVDSTAREEAAGRPSASSNQMHADSPGPREQDSPKPQEEPSAPSAWNRINALSPGRRAIVLAEVISKPLALREGGLWS